MLNKSCWTRLSNSLSPAIVLLLLVWIAPTIAEPTSYNDPLRAIVLQKPKPVDPPICCLKPLNPLEPVEDDLLSFEEWKAKQHRQASQNASSTQPSSGSDNKTGNSREQENAEDATSPSPAVQKDQLPHVPSSTQEVPQQLLPHFRVPLVDRFNYASVECSARVHTAHKSAKHSSNVLSSKKDRYMLSPCNTKGEKQFVVIELCEDIRIDTVQLANFEFFSGVFKEFTVSVAKTYSVDEEGWTIAGAYKAKNVRGVQSFHPPTSLRDFYRYLRVDFHSHYGSEYYCPVSLIRVYGLTHLEEWKWELWETESKAKMEATLKETQIHHTAETFENTSTPDVNASISSPNQQEAPAESNPLPIHLPMNETATDDTPSSTDTATETILHSTDTYLSPSITLNEHPESEAPHVSLPPGSSPANSVATLELSTAPQGTTTGPPILANNTTTTSTSVGTTTVSTTAIALTSSTAMNSHSPSISSILLIPTPLTHTLLPTPITGGESIYRMIMNRLAALEANHTLYEKYMAQQQSIVREALKRLGEDVGRLEGLGKAQRQAYDRTVLEWRRQQKQWQIEHAQLLQRMDYLSDEITMEKRVGVAQLCLLLAVLVFMGLTRGSRGPIVEDRHRWRSTFKRISGDWPKVLTREPELEVMQSAKRDAHHIEFPKGPPQNILMEAAESGSNSLSLKTGDAPATAPARYPLASVELNAHFKNNKDQLFGYEQTSVLFGSHTPSRGRARTISRPRNRTLSGRGILTHPTTPSSRVSGTPTEAKNGYFSNVVTGTPSRGSRSAGIYPTGRPLTLGAIRNGTFGSSYRRSIPLERSHSSHGLPSSLDYGLVNAWTGSGGMPKSARKWARTAHLHEVKGKGRENNIYGDNEETGNVNGGNDVFCDSMPGSESVRTRTAREGRKKKRISIVRRENVDAGVDADGWESVSDVDLDSI